MVVLAAVILSCFGKILFSRPYADTTHERVVGYVREFIHQLRPGQERTYVVGENTFHISLPIESLYLLIVTDKNSNIIEDMETLKRLCRLVSVKSSALNEEGVLNSALEIAFAFDEVINPMGYKEDVNVILVQSNLGLHSENELSHNIKKQMKVSETTEVMKQKDTEIDNKMLTQPLTGVSSAMKDTRDPSAFGNAKLDAGSSVPVTHEAMLDSGSSVSVTEAKETSIRAADPVSLLESRSSVSPDIEDNKNPWHIVRKHKNARGPRILTPPPPPTSTAPFTSTAARLSTSTIPPSTSTQRKNACGPRILPPPSQRKNARGPRILPPPSTSTQRKNARGPRILPPPPPLTSTAPSTSTAARFSTSTIPPSTCTPSTSTAAGPSTIPDTPIPPRPTVTPSASPSYIPPPLPPLTLFERHSYLIAGSQREWAEAQRVAILSLMEAVHVISQARGIPVESLLRAPTRTCAYPDEIDSLVTQLLYKEEEEADEEDVEKGDVTDQREEETSEQRAEVSAGTTETEERGQRQSVEGGQGETTEVGAAAETEVMVDADIGTVVVESASTTSGAETAETEPTAPTEPTEQAAAPST